MKFIRNFFAALLAVVLAVIMVWGIYALYPLKYVDYIRNISEEMGVDRYLVAAVIRAESNFDEVALSKANAKGLMQLTDETALFCGEKLGLYIAEGDVYKPEINIRLGVYYLKRMLDMFNSDTDLAVAAYNAGEGRVKEWLSNEAYSPDGKTLSVIPYEETRRHVEKINKYISIYKILYPEF